MAAPSVSPWQTASITRIVRRTPRVASFFLAPERPFAHRAGQHVDIRLTAPDGYQARRSYSIASAPEDTQGIELAIERLEDGEVSPFFHDVAAEGDAIELRGPIGGHFVWSADDPAPLLLVGGGSGVVPLMSMLRHRAAAGAGQPALLLLSARGWDDVIFRDELLALHDRRDGLELVLATTREAARRPGDFARRIDRPMAAEALARLGVPVSGAYICGGNPFVSAAADAMVAAGVPAAGIRTERFGE
ncbi:MAG: ferredoxin reductase [Alphaproteobacteria bacterium]